MKKLINFSPFIVAIIIIAILIGVFGVFDSNKSPNIEVSSSTLTEMVKSSKLSTAQFIQHGIASSVVEGKKECSILYYATIRANIDFDDISFIVDDKSKTVKVILPKKFDFDVELLRDDEHPFYYYPNASKRTAKEIEIICKDDARSKAEKNENFQTAAKESLEKSIIALLEPLLKSNNYTIIID